MLTPSSSTTFYLSLSQLSVDLPGHSHISISYSSKWLLGQHSTLMWSNFISTHTYLMVTFGTLSCLETGSSLKFWILTSLSLTTASYHFIPSSSLPLGLLFFNFEIMLLLTPPFPPNSQSVSIRSLQSLFPNP